VAAIASCLLAFLLIFGSDGGRPTAQPSSAYAAEVIHYAETTPRLLMTAPGWRVTGLWAGGKGGESGMEFAQGDGPNLEEVELSWTPTSFESLAERAQRFASELQTQPLSTKIPVLGSTATIVKYHEWSSGDLGLFALWQEGGYVLNYE